MSTETHKLPDICRRKHGGSETSEAANERIHSRKEVDRSRILAYTDFMGSYGITFKEVCSALDLKPQTASARLAELKQAVELVPKGIRRDNCAVFVRAKGQLSLLDKVRV